MPLKLCKILYNFLMYGAEEIAQMIGHLPDKLQNPEFNPRPDSCSTIGSGTEGPWAVMGSTITVAPERGMTL